MQRHLATTKEWFPHEHVPYGRGRDFDADEPWCVDAADLGGGADRRRRAQLADRQPADRGQPAVLLPHDRARARRRRPVGCLVEAVDRRGRPPLDGDLRLPDGDAGRRPGRARAGPDAPGVDGRGARAARRPSTCSAYVALQELATRIAHRNTGRLLGDSAGYDVMMRVAADENLHHLFYRDLTSAAIELDPSTAVPAIERQVVGFEMPGTGIPDFAAHAAAIAKAGIYDLDDPPRPDPRSGRPAPLGPRVADRPRRRRRGIPRPPPRPPRQERAGRPPPRRPPRQHDVTASV